MNAPMKFCWEGHPIGWIHGNCIAPVDGAGRRASLQRIDEFQSAGDDKSSTDTEFGTF